MEARIHTKKVEEEEAFLKEKLQENKARTFAILEEISKLEKERLDEMKKRESLICKIAENRQRMLECRGAIVSVWDHTKRVDPPEVLIYCDDWASHLKDTRPKLSQNMAEGFSLIFQELKKHAFQVPGFLCKVNSKKLEGVCAAFTPDSHQNDVWKTFCAANKSTLDEKFCTRYDGTRHQKLKCMGLPVDCTLPPKMKIDLNNSSELSIEYQEICIVCFRGGSACLAIDDREYTDFGRETLNTKKIGPQWSFETRADGQPLAFLHRESNEIISTECVMAFMDALLDILLFQIRKDIV